MAEHVTLIPIQAVDPQHLGRSRKVMVAMSSVAAVVFPSETTQPFKGCVVLTNGIAYEFSEVTGADEFIKHVV
jgi:hypothetical protein